MKVKPEAWVARAPERVNAIVWDGTKEHAEAITAWVSNNTRAWVRISLPGTYPQLFGGLYTITKVGMTVQNDDDLYEPLGMNDVLIIHDEGRVSVMKTEDFIEKYQVA